MESLQPTMQSPDENTAQDPTDRPPAVALDEEKPSSPTVAISASERFEVSPEDIKAEWHRVPAFLLVGSGRKELDRALEELPFFARLLLVARCARRAQRLFNGNGVTAEQKESLSRGIQSMEEACQTGACDSNSMKDAANKLIGLDLSLKATNPTASAAVHVGGRAALLGIAGAGSVGPTASMVLLDTIEVDTDSAERIRRDFALLRAAAREGKWNDTTPVNPKAMGPTLAVMTRFHIQTKNVFVPISRFFHTQQETTRNEKFAMFYLRYGARMDRKSNGSVCSSRISPMAGDSLRHMRRCVLSRLR